MIQYLSRLIRARADRPRGARPRRSRAAVLGEGLEPRHLLATLTSSISGLWSGVFTNTTGLVGPITGLGTNSVQFGTPIPGGGPNVLTYNGARIPTTVRVLHHTSPGLVVGNLTFLNTPLASPPLSGINLRLSAQTNIGGTAVNVPLNLIETSDSSGPVPDTISLAGRPTIQLSRGLRLQILGFGIINRRGGLMRLSNQMSVPEGATVTVPILAKLTSSRG